MLALPAASAKPVVSDVRLGVHPDKTRLVIELSEAPSYRVFSLADPARVVIDLPAVDWSNGAEQDGVGLVSALRYGLFMPGTSRVVLDLDKPARVLDTFVLPPRGGKGYRFVLDVGPTDRETFLAQTRQPPVESKVPLPALAVSLPAAPKKGGDSRPTVVIDPGHGGVDPGAIGVSGLYEKDLVLGYGLALRDALLKTGRYRVVMTRDDDRFIPLRGRVKIANDAGGDLFISLHANINASKTLHGAAVYTLSENASDDEAAALAAKENKADIIAGVDLSGQNEVVSQILIDLAQRETMNLSKGLGNMLVDSLGQSTTLLRHTHRYAGFAVLKSPSVPSVLVEVGYMSNPREERDLRSPKHRAKVVAALVQAIDQYFTVQQAYR
ncbi:N-acetylmuramoyl-L-alanine amidase [Tistlia consotensis]|uniref:N-acetylmuramoyl-L-alanine amidase n=1 Tax=Tistlia consotensis TaxID=1321365 RepID=UPI0013562FCE|nr:N-acetylmuramoyl-L-alanine amidase [Tistlia consotensis]